MTASIDTIDVSSDNVQFVDCSQATVKSCASADIIYIHSSEINTIEWFRIKKQIATDN